MKANMANDLRSDFKASFSMPMADELIAASEERASDPIVGELRTLNAHLRAIRGVVSFIGVAALLWLLTLLG